MSSSAPVPPAPEIVVAKAAKVSSRPPYVKVSSITDPKLAQIPDVDRFLALCDGEKLVKSWRVRVRRPKFPWWLFIGSFFVTLIFLVPFWFAYENARRNAEYYNSYEPQIYRSPSDSVKSDTPSSSYNDKSYTPEYSTKATEVDPNVIRSLNPGIEVPESSPSEIPRAIPPPEPPKTAPPDTLFPELEKVRYEGPALLAQGPPRRVTSFLSGIFFFFLLWLVLPTCIVIWFFVFSLRGHTFLYLTNRRLILVELEQNVLTRQQTVLNYTLENIAGFTLHAQRGLKKLFYVILLKEKRTFYMAIVTRTLAQFALGAVNTWGSQYEPGLDAVAVCAELDALVLGLKADLAPR